jgi:hypothetical protein
MQGRFDPIQERERIVDHGDIWLCLQCLFDGFLAIGGLSNNFPTGARLKDRAQS